jgi:MFS transporter, DHA2 family, methylenomycin A resistance protein
MAVVTPMTAHDERPAARRRLALVVLCAAVLVAQLDTSVVNLAVKPIGAAFGVEVAALQWVLDSYNLVYAVLLLSGGLLADLIGRRLVLLLGAGVFTGASLLCALAPNLSLLITGRALSGLGAALMLPASLAMIRVVWPQDAERERVLGIWAACNGLAMAFGPTVGGALIAGLGWRSVFAVVLPFGIFTLALAVPAMPENADPKGRDFDAAGQVLGALALAGLALAAIEAAATPWMAGTALLTAAVALAGFIGIERRRGDAAMVPLSLFGAGAFRGAMLATTGMTFGMYAVLFLMPLIWQQAGTTPVRAGLALMPMAQVFVLVSPFSGPLTARFGAPRLSSGGVGLIGLGLLVLAATAGAQSLLPAEAGLVLAGLGMGLATGPLLGLAVGAVPPQRAGTASALINVARMAGATLGVAVLGSVFAVMGGGAAGLRLAMLGGGLVQLMGALAAWLETRRATDRAA